MVYRKGERTKASIDREFPEQVELEIPDGGLGRRLTAMHEFVRTRGYDHATRGIGSVERSRRGNRDGMRWCFREAGHADAFCQAFGGTRVRG